jgi:hypothetical protein
MSGAPRPLYPPAECPQYPLDKMLDGPQSRSGQHGKSKIPYLTGTRTPTQPDAIRYTDSATPTFL